MAAAAFVGVVGIWLFGIGWLVCAASGVYIVAKGRCLRRNSVIEGRRAIKEGLFRLAVGLCFASVTLLLAAQATPEVWRYFQMAR